MKIDFGVFPSILAITFIVLKFCGVIAWSWWWVLSPLWIPFAIVAAVFVLAGVIAVLSVILEK